MKIVKISYLEMKSAPEGKAIPCPDSQAQIVPERLNSQEFLKIYKEIGENYRWDTRYELSAEELKTLLESAHTETLILKIHGEKLGICEFDTSKFPEIEILHFGLVGKLHGKGFGRYFLDYVLRELWKRSPSRIWLHTDSDDHPNAIPTYERAGFRIYKVEEQVLTS